MKLQVIKKIVLLNALFASVLLIFGIATASTTLIEVAGGIFCLIGFGYALRNIRRPKQVADAQTALDQLQPLLQRGVKEHENAFLARRLDDGLSEALLFSAFGGALGSFSSLLAGIPGATSTVFYLLTSG